MMVEAVAAKTNWKKKYDNRVVPLRKNSERPKKGSNEGFEFGP